MLGKKFTKSDLINSIYEKTGMTRQEIRQITDLFIGEIKDALVNGISVELRGFGTFEVRLRKGRKGARNPRTGEPVAAHSHGIAAFRPGRELKQDVWHVSGGGLADEEA